MNIKLFLTTCLLIGMTVTVFSQRQGGLKEESRERIEAQRVAFITQRLDLSPDEAAKFWPIYNQHKDALKDVRDDIERPDLMNISDSEANTIIEKHLQLEEKRLQLKRDLYTKLRVVLSPRKILMLHAAERDFNRELLRKAQELRRK